MTIFHELRRKDRKSGQQGEIRGKSGNKGTHKKNSNSKSYSGLHDK